ncbi:MAG: preprotein translocase subunit SecY [Candidatus Promineifilaceae bacterium]|jgi:preprotein translocase subunit SecY
MISAFANCLKIPELRNRIFFTMGMVFVSRIITAVPTPGVNAAELERAITAAQQKTGGGILGWLDLFAGGALSRCAVGALTIWPYISASIIIQLMTAIIPTLERLQQEGETGRQKITQYTRYLTLAICCVQGLFLAISLENYAQLGFDRPIVMNPGWGFRLLTVLALTTATMLLMWLGEQITERGLGNGVSLIITVNIVSSLPQALAQVVQMNNDPNITPFHFIALVLMIFLVTAGTILLTQGQRKVPIHSAKRVVGKKVYGGQNSYMPLRVNYGGVMPIIFAGAMLTFPTMLIGRLPWDWAGTFSRLLAMGEPLYLAAYAGMIMFFSYFWVATQFNPLRIADDLKKNSSYVPGIRPGRPTADYLDTTMTKVTFFGALFLTVIAVIPDVLGAKFGVPWLVASFMGGTSLLIIVAVVLDTMRQAESHLVMRHYDGFLNTGRIRGRR